MCLEFGTNSLEGPIRVLECSCFFRDWLEGTVGLLFGVGWVSVVEVGAVGFGVGIEIVVFCGSW